MEKVYKVEFMEYTNCLKNTVYNPIEENISDRYIEIGKEPFLIRESELKKYSAYGKGFRTLIFVGYIIS